MQPAAPDPRSAQDGSPGDGEDRGRGAARPHPDTGVAPDAPATPHRGARTPRLTTIPLPRRPFLPGHPLAALRVRPAEAPCASDGEAWLFGADLYNAGLLWEAHEAWEQAWQNARRDPARADEARTLQGLIQVAAGCLKLRLAEREPALRLLYKGAEKLSRPLDSPGCELDLTRFVGDLDKFAPLGPAAWRNRPALWPCPAS